MSAAVLAAVAAHYGVTVGEIRGASKRPALSLPREAVCYILRSVHGASYPDIARALGRRDHGSAMRALRRLEARTAADPGLYAEMNALAAWVAGTAPPSPSPADRLTRDARLARKIAAEYERHAEALEELERACAAPSDCFQIKRANGLKPA